MKVVIAGSRSIHHGEHRHLKRVYELCNKFCEDYNTTIDMVVSGCAAGPDKLGEQWAKETGTHVARFPAKWDLHGKAAGPIRNQEMGEFADAAIILWDGKSKGSKHMCGVMRKLNKPFILDIFEPVVYKYVHQPNGIIKVVAPDQSPSIFDNAYD